MTAAAEIRTHSGVTLPATVERAAAPRYIRHCVNSPYDEKPWHIALWKRGDPSTMKTAPYRCGSWRCAGKCRRKRASRDFARIRDAFAPIEDHAVCFLVLTLDWNGFYGGRAWESLSDAYRELSRMSRNFLASLNRWLRREGMDPVGSRWVQVVEAHKNGRPHINLLCASSGLARYLRANTGTGVGGRGVPAGPLRDLLERAGFGRASSAEPCRNRGGAAGYLVKLAGKLGDDVKRLGAEVAKLTQVPLAAPKNFRRLRSGKGFLPPRYRSEEWTGAVVDENGRFLGYEARREKLERECESEFREVTSPRGTALGLERVRTGAPVVAAQVQELVRAQSEAASALGHEREIAIRARHGRRMDLGPDGVPGVAVDIHATGLPPGGSVYERRRGMPCPYWRTDLGDRPEERIEVLPPSDAGEQSWERYPFARGWVLDSRPRPAGGVGHVEATSPPWPPLPGYMSVAPARPSKEATRRIGAPGKVLAFQDPRNDGRQAPGVDAASL